MEDSEPRSLGLLAVAASSAAVNVLLAIRMASTLARFRELFAGFGADLPAATKLVLKLPHIWWLLAFASLAVFVWVATKSLPARDELRRMKLASRLVIILTVLTYGLTAVALYVPIFKLGAVV